MATIKKRTQKNIKFIGGVLILLGPIVFAFSLPLSHHLCNSSVLECGFENLGAIGYSLYAGVILSIIGILVLIAGLVLGLKKRK